MILIARPEPRASEMVQMLAEAGYHAIACPVMALSAREGVEEKMAQRLRRNPQALIATSQHAFRALPAYTLPLLVVGEASRQTAEEIGYTNVVKAGKHAVGLLHYIRSTLSPEDGPLLYLRGTEIQHDLAQELGKDGFDVMEIVTYQATPTTALPALAQQVLDQGKASLVVCYSRRNLYQLELLLSEEQMQSVQLVAASHTMGEAANPHWKQVTPLPEASDTALLEALKHLSRGGRHTTTGAG